MENNVNPSKISSGSTVDDHMHPSKNLALDSSQGSGLATLEPYIPDPLPQRKGNNRKGNNVVRGYEVMPGVFEPTNYDRFLSLKFDDDKRAQDLDMFNIEKEIVNACGREPNILFQHDGSLLIEVSSLEESLKLQALNTLDGTSTKCSPHKSLNQCRGVIRSTLLMKYSEERLLKEFENQNVVEVKQMKKYIAGVLTPLPTYIVTFNLVRLPPKLKAAWLRLHVRPYVPAPRRCFFCQKFGHVSNGCRRKLKGEKRTCDNCGQDDHGECSRPSLCINCGENHPASSKTCERFVLEREIQAVRAKENIPFSEARRQVLAQFIRPGVTFASVTRKPKTVLKEDKPSSSSGNENAHRNTTVLRQHQKRRLSDDGQYDSPSSKSNKFEVLNDEMDSDLLKFHDRSDKITTESVSKVCSLGQKTTPTLARFVTRAEVHAPDCSVEQEGAPASAGSGKSAEAVPSGSLDERPEAQPLDGSTESSGVRSLAGLGEPAEAMSLAVSDETAEEVSSDGSHRGAGGRISTSPKKEKLTKSGNEKAREVNGSGKEVSKIPKLNAAGVKSSNKSTIKNIPGAIPEKGGSRMKR